MTFDEAMLAEYKAWHWDQVRTGDLDPMYPWLAQFGPLHDLTRDQWASLTLTYLVYYRIDSAYQAWIQAGRCVPTRPHKYPTATERRGLRSPEAMMRHLDSLQSQLEGEPYEWLTGAQSWEHMTDRVMRVHGNGRWAAYKACDLAVNVHDAPYRATDAGHAHSSGPRKGLRLLGVPDPGSNTPESVRALDLATEALMDHVGETDVSRIETSLCDFYSHKQGRHPLGHDVLALSGQIRHIPKGAAAFRLAGLSAT